ncbi:acyl-CoA dehydratase activase [Alkaliphilus transvaalensis]|uniref:acyl-CoA dehydratase activase n=1 Tax=Alkaliphilus transvaalensis TaxID=114628 RepID=UPI0006868569|nr:acyl-CoA dehydratase activase [Alkaliphilus transvaalensis]
MFSLGIDIGYSSIKFVLINKNLEVIDLAYILHKGRVKEEIVKYVSYLENKYGEGITKGGATGQGSKFLSDKKGISWINEVTSLVEGSKHCREDIKSVIEIGGQSSKYITNVDDNGNNSIKISINSNCSAGTGSFLEEQVSRLGIRLEDYSKLTEKASYIPRIAGRCSVFAKTDIIHHQQEGTETKEILLGLAYALVKNYRANVVKKNPIQPPILLTGGVAYNDAIVKALKDVMKLRNEEMITPDNCGNVAALGAAVIGLKERLLLDLSDIKRIITEKDQSQNLIQDAVSFPTLEQFGSHDSINKHECKDISSQSYVKGYIGIDVGSTSTNVILMDEDYAVLDFRYLRTLGDPIAAVSKGLLEIKKHMVENNKELEILGVGLLVLGDIWQVAT